MNHVARYVADARSETWLSEDGGKKVCESHIAIIDTYDPHAASWEGESLVMSTVVSDDAGRANGVTYADIMSMYQSWCGKLNALWAERNTKTRALVKTLPDILPYIDALRIVRYVYRSRGHNVPSDRCDHDGLSTSRPQPSTRPTKGGPLGSGTDGRGDSREAAERFLFGSRPAESPLPLSPGDIRNVELVHDELVSLAHAFATGGVPSSQLTSVLRRLAASLLLVVKARAAASYHPDKPQRDS